MQTAVAEPQCYGFGIMLEGSPPFSLSSASANTLGLWALGASTNFDNESPLRATPTTPWTNTLEEYTKRRRYQIPAQPDLATDEWNQGQLSNSPTGCLTSAAVGNQYNGGLGDLLMTPGDA
jgi:hypothetical protein